MILKILSVIAPVFVCAGIGFAWGRMGKPFDTRMVGALALNLGMPCLAFSTLTKLQVSPEAFVKMAGVYAIAIACFLAVGLTVIALLRLPAHTYLPVFTSSNTGNMGLPLCLFAFGPEGLALGICIFVMSSLFSFTAGWSIYAGRLAADVLYNNPLIYAVALALVFMVTGAETPVWLANTTRLIGGLAIPLMLVSLGVAIARMNATGAGTIVVISVVKLLAGFAVGYGLSVLFGLEGAARGVLIIECTMPVAVHNYMFAQRFNRSPPDTASMILISTAISLATLPLLMAVVL
ncbi:MAG: AEC family transporter [Rhodospirillaceae bacterium]